jgi:prepilin-type N-terminal cleavage/methylation domain-containing protein
MTLAVLAGIKSTQTNMKQNRQTRSLTKPTRNSGFSLLEVMIAMLLLGVGLMGSIGMICVAAASNSGSKLNTTAATLAESTMERIVALPQSATGNGALTSLADCSGNVFTMDTSKGGGVDFRQPAVPNYSMQYVMCNGGQNMTYDVRWSINDGPTPSTQLVTVSVKSLVSAGPAALARPITLTTLRGN